MQVSPRGYSAASPSPASPLGFGSRNTASFATHGSSARSSSHGVSARSATRRTSGKTTNDPVSQEVLVGDGYLVGRPGRGCPSSLKLQLKPQRSRIRIRVVPLALCKPQRPIQRNRRREHRLRSRVQLHQLIPRPLRLLNQPRRQHPPDPHPSIRRPHIHPLHLAHPRPQLIQRPQSDAPPCFLTPPTHHRHQQPPPRQSKLPWQTRHLLIKPLMLQTARGDVSDALAVLADQVSCLCKHRPIDDLNDSYLVHPLSFAGRGTPA